MCPPIWKNCIGSSKPYRYNPRSGKGSHGILYVGDQRTTVKYGELATGTFHTMLKQLDIAKEEF